MLTQGFLVEASKGIEEHKSKLSVEGEGGNLCNGFTKRKEVLGTIGS